jgi:hypothetical protein
MGKPKVKKKKKKDLTLPYLTPSFRMENGTAKDKNAFYLIHWDLQA